MTKSNETLFEPIRFTHEDRLESTQRPSRSYWEDVWIKLKKNNRALFSLYCILFIIVFCVFGPLFWDLDPAQQDLNQVSKTPFLKKKALVISDQLSWVDPTVSGRSDKIQLSAVKNPNTGFIILDWKPVKNAVEYQVFRHILEPSGEKDLGVPLITLGKEQTHYVDELQLEERRYFYTVYINDELKTRKTISVFPVPAIQEDKINFSFEKNNSTFIHLQPHPLGTDNLGRDMLARIMYGGRISLFIGFFAPLFFISVGTIYGSISGFLGGRVDMWMMRFADFVIALPFLLFVILIKIGFGIGPGESGVSSMLFALVIMRWPDSARLIRGQVLQLREQEYIQAAKLFGSSTSYIVLKHILPNTLGLILVSLTFAIPSAIFTEAFLSFIGMGVVPPTPSWGAMCNDGIQTMLNHPHELIIPALMISLTVLSFNLFGDALRDILDPKSKVQST